MVAVVAGGVAGVEDGWVIAVVLVVAGVVAVVGVAVVAAVAARMRIGTRWIVLNFSVDTTHILAFEDVLRVINAK